MTSYAGNGSDYPVDFVIPDDSATPTAAEFLPSIEALGDRTETIRQKGLLRLVRQIYTTTGTFNWTVPADLAGTVCWVEMCGGGGGGGAGGQVGMTNATGFWCSGGAGGGGAIAHSMQVDLSSATPGTSSIPGYVGAGGTGGNAVGVAGNDGGFSYLDVSVLGGETLIAPGAQGGSGGRIINVSNQLVLALGGAPFVGGRVYAYWQAPAGSTAMVPVLQPGQGGHSSAANLSYQFNGGSTPTYKGGDSPSSGNGGTPGARGTDSGSYGAGGGGGGGGGGPWGQGSLGGNGGNGNNAGTGGTGNPGGSAVANSGGGGGGGGGPGYGSAALGTFGVGGDGGSGRVIITYWAKGVTLP